MTVALESIRASVRAWQRSACRIPKPMGNVRIVPNRILLVDDNRDILELVSASLTGAGFEVVARQSAEECLEHDLASEFDAALVDLRLPGVGGAELCAHLVA